MIQVSVSGDNFDPILELIRRMEFPDLTPLVAPLTEIMLEDNREGLLAGTDSFGDPMTPLEDSTWHGRKGSGPPTIPEYGNAALITDYRVDPEDISPLHVRLVGTWPSLHWVHFHVTGTRNMVARDPTGIRPSGQEKVRVVLENFARTLTGG